jgi:hypothetical protein
MTLHLRDKRRIGPEPLSERLKDPIRFVVVWIPIFVVASIFITAVKAWGDNWSMGTLILVWCAIFGGLVAVVLVSGLFGPGRERSLAFGVTGLALAAVIWFWGLPILVTLGVVDVLPITPVTP